MTDPNGNMPHNAQEGPQGAFGDPHAGLLRALDLLTAEAAEKAYEREQRGYAFELKFTSPGKSAQVRRMSLPKMASIGALSAEMQATATMAFDAARNMDSETMTFPEIVHATNLQTELHKVICISGFINPPLYATREEARRMGGIWVDWIDERDREAYADTVMNPDTEEAQAMLPFPENGVAGASTGSSVPAAAEPERPLVLVQPAPDRVGMEREAVPGV